METDRLERFTTEFGNKFGKVLESDKAYEDVAIVGEPMPVFSANPPYDEIEYPKKRVEHRMFESKRCRTQSDAVDDIIKIIKAFAESIIPENHNYKHYWLFWRFRPEVGGKIDFETKKAIFRAWVRLSIIAEG